MQSITPIIFIDHKLKYFGDAELNMLLKLFLLVNYHGRFLQCKVIIVYIKQHCCKL